METWLIVLLIILGVFLIIYISTILFVTKTASNMFKNHPALSRNMMHGQTPSMPISH